MTSRDYRDLCVEDLADREAWLLDRLASLEADVQAYRTLSQQLLHALHHVTLERDVLREQRQRDRDRARACLQRHAA